MLAAQDYQFANLSGRWETTSQGHDFARVVWHLLHRYRYDGWNCIFFHKQRYNLRGGVAAVSDTDDVSAAILGKSMLGGWAFDDVLHARVDAQLWRDDSSMGSC